MRKIVSVGLIFIMTLAAASSTLVAQSGGTLTGVARGNHLQSIASVNVNPFAVVISTTCSRPAVRGLASFAPGSSAAPTILIGW